MKKFLVLLAAFSPALLNQASAAAYTPAPISTWYFAEGLGGNGGTLANENTTTPSITAITELQGTFYGTFSDVTLGVGDSISYTLSFMTTGPETSLNNSYRFGLFNNSGDVGLAFPTDGSTATTNWTGIWSRNTSLVSASSGGQPFNFGTVIATLSDSSYTGTPYEGNPGINTFSLTIERTATEYLLTSSMLNSGGANASLVGTMLVADYAVEGDTFNTFGVYFPNAVDDLTLTVLVPEPSSIALVTVASLGLMLRRRR